MEFENKNWFYLLILLPLVIGLFYLYLHWRKNAIKKLGDELLVAQLMPRTSMQRKWIKLSLLLFACIAFTIGLANLRMGSKKQKVSGESAEVIICFDVSNSMLAEDVKPNRLIQANSAPVQGR